MVKPSPKDKIIDAALSVASEMNWQFVTLTDIAREAQVSLSDVRGYFEDKTDILASYGRRVDQKMLDSVSDPDLSLSVKERLFDILMARFDALNADREAVVSIVSSFKLDPKQAVITLPHVCKSMIWALEAAGENTNGMHGALKIMGLTGAYLKVLGVWCKDESPDLSKTMASLDKVLGQCEKFFLK